MAEPEAVDQAWRDLDGFRALMFVSAAAVNHFFDRRPPNGPPLAVRCWATGPGTCRALRQAGVPPQLIDSPPEDAAQFDTEHLWPVVVTQVLAGDTVAIIRGTDEESGPEAGSVSDSGVGRDWLAGQLRQVGAHVRWVVAYQRSAPRWDDAQQAQAAQAASDGSVWVFSSSQAALHLTSLMPGQDWSVARAVATHERIATVLRTMGWGRVCIGRPDVPGLVQALASLESDA